MKKKDNKKVTTIAFDDFSLKWRFSSPGHNILPKNDLALIKPLNPEMAKQMNAHSLSFLKNGELDKSQFKIVSLLDTPHQHQKTNDWLSNEIPEATNEIIVSWDEENCAFTTKRIFCKYWDDFCYPSSDDIIVFPETGEWVLYYFHEDKFQVGHTI